MAAKKDGWFCQLVQSVIDKSVEINVVGCRVPTDSNYSHYFRTKKEAIAAAVNTARTLYYNTVLGTSIPLDTRVSATYHFNKNPRIEIKERITFPMTTKMVAHPTIPNVLLEQTLEVNISKSKKEAEALLDKITKRYAKYIEDEDYWQDLFKEQARET